jgi:hypothetical protein
MKLPIPNRLSRPIGDYLHTTHLEAFVPATEKTALISVGVFGELSLILPSPRLVSRCPARKILASSSATVKLHALCAQWLTATKRVLKGGYE